jgi:uncharacterized membrane protein
MSKFLWRKNLRQRDMELFIGRWLRLGVFTAAAIALTGGILYLSAHPPLPDYTHFAGTEPQYRHLPGILQGVLQGNGLAIIQLAVVILIATPILRILFSVAAFTLEKDRMYVLITLIVLCVILLGMFSGLGG